MATIPAFGQMTIFDIPKEQNKRRPCEYSFQRYIGQRVRLYSSIEGIVRGTIVEVKSYYTIIKSNCKLYAGTPTNTAPDTEE